MIKTYVRQLGDFGLNYIVPYENFKWTGRYKIATINGTTRIFIERWMKLFGLIPICRTWESDKNIIFQEEEIIICKCDV